MQKFSGKIIEFSLNGNPRKYIMGAMRFGNLRKYTVAEPFNAKTGHGEQRAVIESHAKHLKKVMSDGTYAPTVFTLGTRQKHRDEVEIKDGVANLSVSEDSKLPILDGNNRTAALERLRSEGGATEKLVDNLYIPYLLYLDGNTREDFVALQAGKPVSRDHMLSVRIATGLIDKKHAPYFKIARDVAQILHSTKDSFCHNLIQFDSNGTKLPLSLNSICGKGASDLAFSLYGGAKIANNYGDGNDAEWLANCILTAFRAINQDPDTSFLLERGNLLSPVPDGTKAGTTLIIAMGNMLAERLALKGIDEPEDIDIQLLIDCATENFSGITTNGNTSADRKRALFKGFVVDFFADLIANGDEDEDSQDEDGLDVPVKTIGAHEGIPVPLIRLLSASTFNVSKLPTEGKRRGRPPKAVVSTAVVDENEEDVDVEVDRSTVEDPVDAEAFAEDDAKAKVLTVTEEEAPWDEEDSSF